MISPVSSIPVWLSQPNLAIPAHWVYYLLHKRNFNRLRFRTGIDTDTTFSEVLQVVELDDHRAVGGLELVVRHGALWQSLPPYMRHWLLANQRPNSPSGSLRLFFEVLQHEIIDLQLQIRNGHLDALDPSQALSMSDRVVIQLLGLRCRDWGNGEAWDERAIAYWHELLAKMLAGEGGAAIFLHGIRLFFPYAADRVSLSMTFDRAALRLGPLRIRDYWRLLEPNSVPDATTEKAELGLPGRDLLRLAALARHLLPAWVVFDLQLSLAEEDKSEWLEAGRAKIGILDLNQRMA